MMGNVMTVSCIRGAALALAAIGLFLAEPARAAPKPDIIGDVVNIIGPGASPVIIVRRGEELRRIKTYEYLYADDEIYLTSRAAQVEIEYFGGESKTLVGATYFDRRHTFKLPSRGLAEDWSHNRIVRLVTLFPTIFEPPERRPATLTTPNGPKGARGSLRAAPILPEVEQIIPADQPLQRLPVVWRGGPGRVRLEDAAGSVLAEAVSKIDGFVDLRAPPLPPGQYWIRVTPLRADGQDDPVAAGVAIPVRTVSGLGETRDLSEADRVVAAAEALRGPAGGRLRALSDMDRLSTTSFKAWAVLRGVARGDVR
jgi:hypothetical protein